MDRTVKAYVQQQQQPNSPTGYCFRELTPCPPLTLAIIPLQTAPYDSRLARLVSRTLCLAELHLSTYDHQPHSPKWFSTHLGGTLKDQQNMFFFFFMTAAVWDRFESQPTAACKLMYAIRFWSFSLMKPVIHSEFLPAWLPNCVSLWLATRSRQTLSNLLSDWSQVMNSSLISSTTLRCYDCQL
jgi:hypothetical protein